MSKVLKCIRDDRDTVTLWFDSVGAGGPDVLNFYFENQGVDCNKSFEIKLLEIESETMVLPIREYAATVTMPSDKWKTDILNFEALEADTVQLGSDGATFSVRPSGNFMVALTVEYDLAGRNSEGLELLLKSPCKEHYAHKLLKTFTNATPFSPLLCIELDRDVPSSFEYGSPGVGFIRFFLAPKIMDEPPDYED